MLVPPSASEVLSSTSFDRLVPLLIHLNYPTQDIDPTKLKPRQFAKSSTTDRSRLDQSLWTETPEQRQQRLVDEVAGKKRRAVNADVDALSPEEALELRKRQKIDHNIRKGVEEHTVRLSLLLPEFHYSSQI